MARNDINLQGVYNTLKNEGYTPPSYEEFVKDMSDDSNLRGVYETLKENGYEPPEFDVFKTDMFGQEPAPERPVAPAPAPATPATTAKEIGSEVVSGVGGGNIGSALKREVGTTTSPEQQLSRIQARNDAMFASGKELL